MNKDNQMEKNEGKMLEDIRMTFKDIRTVYSILKKLKENGYRCSPEQGLLMSEIMVGKTHQVVTRLRPYCDDIEDSMSDTVPVMIGTFDHSKTGFHLL